MARFARTHPAPSLKGHYSVFRQHVRQDFRACCAYCLMPELHACGEGNFELDHFRPQSKFPDLTRDFHNLYWSCHVCNKPANKGSKWPSPALEAQGIGFVDFCRDDFHDHYQFSEAGLWVPLTNSARYTIETIGLNSAHLVELRVKIGWQP